MGRGRVRERGGSGRGRVRGRLGGSHGQEEGRVGEKERAARRITRSGGGEVGKRKRERAARRITQSGGGSGREEGALA